MTGKIHLIKTFDLELGKILLFLQKNLKAELRLLLPKFVQFTQKDFLNGLLHDSAFYSGIDEPSTQEQSLSILEKFQMKTFLHTVTFFTQDWCVGNIMNASLSTESFEVFIHIWLWEKAMWWANTNHPDTVTRQRQYMHVSGKYTTVVLNWQASKWTKLNRNGWNNSRFKF